MTKLFPQRLLTLALLHINHTQVELVKLMKPVMPILVNSATQMLNPYKKSYASFGKINETGSTERGPEFRQKLLISLGYLSSTSSTSKVRNAELKCMVSGVESSERDAIRAAHIIPAVTSFDALEALNLTEEDIDSPRNGLLLAFNIERAYDSLWLSFVRHPILDVLVLKVWNIDRFRDHPVFQEAKMTIKNCINRTLDLSRVNSSVPHNPFLRGLAFQAYNAYIKHFKHIPLTVSIRREIYISSDKDNGFATLFDMKILDMKKEEITRARVAEGDNDGDDEDDNFSQSVALDVSESRYGVDMNPFGKAFEATTFDVDDLNEYADGYEEEDMNEGAEQILFSTQAQTQILDEFTAMVDTPAKRKRSKGVAKSQGASLVQRSSGNESKVDKKRRRVQAERNAQNEMDS